MIDHAMGPGLLGTDLLAQHEQLHGALVADETRQKQRTRRFRNDTEIDEG